MAEPPRTRTGFLDHKLARAYGTMISVNHPVYVVRHGQSEWNVRRLTQGQTSHPRLTDVGRCQALSSANLIAADLRVLGLTAGHVVTSDLTRATETAEILAAHLGTSIAFDARLREQHWGFLEGRSYEETRMALDRTDRTDPHASIAGGETQMDVYDRMAAVLGGLDPTRVTILVSHGDSIRAALAVIKGVKPHETDGVEVPNGAVARITETITWLGQ